MAVGLSLVMVIYKSAFPRISTLGRLPGTDIYRSERMYPAAEHQPGLLLLRIDAPVYFANVEVRGAARAACCGALSWCRHDVLPLADPLPHHHPATPCCGCCCRACAISSTPPWRAPAWRVPSAASQSSLSSWISALCTTWTPPPSTGWRTLSRRCGCTLCTALCARAVCGGAGALTRPRAHPPPPPPCVRAQLQDEGVQLVLANPTKDALLMLKRGGVYAKLGEDRVHVTVADAVAYAQSQVKILSAQNAV